MRHAVIGGIGFVGANLVEVLRGQGDDVIVVSRRSSASKRSRLTSFIQSTGASVVFMDNITPEGLVKLGADVYYHVAGKITGNMSTMMSSHVGLLKVIVEAASSVGSRVVYVSSAAVASEIRGLPRGSVVYEEERHLEKDVYVHKTPYEISKAEGERLLVASDEKLNGKWSIVRPSLVFGPWGDQPQWRLVYRAARLGLALSFGSRNAIYSRDLALILAMAGRGSLDRRWVYANWPPDVDLSDIGMELCMKIKGKRCKSVSLRWALRMASAVPGSPFKMMYRMLKSNYKFRSRYLDEFRYTDLGEAVSRFLEWAKSYWG